MAIFIKQEKETELKVSEKHVPLRIFGFLLALVVAVGSIAFGVSRIGYKEEGMYELTAAADQDLPRYANGVHAKFFFRGSSAQIKLAIGSADKVYSQALKDAYRLLDAHNEYPGLVNLASLNARLNQDVQLSPALFDVLRDAWEKTRTAQGYSLFAGPLYAEWESVLILTEPQDFDPLRSEDTAARLEALRRETGDLSRFRLIVTDEENCVLRLEVDEDYLRFLEELELEPAVLDLNLLREAYLLKLVAAELEAQGLTEGYLSTDSGMLLSISGQKGGEYCLYDYREGRPALAAVAPVEAGSACCLWTAFPLTLGVETEFYTITEEKEHLRNPYLPADGTDRELLLSSCVIRSDGDPVQAGFESLRLRMASDAEELERLSEESDSAVAWLLQGDDSGTLGMNELAEGLFRPAE